MITHDSSRCGPETGIVGIGREAETGIEPLGGWNGAREIEKGAGGQCEAMRLTHSAQQIIGALTVDTGNIAQVGMVSLPDAASIPDDRLHLNEGGPIFNIGTGQNFKIGRDEVG